MRILATALLGLAFFPNLSAGCSLFDAVSFDCGQVSWCNQNEWGKMTEKWCSDDISGAYFAGHSYKCYDCGSNAPQAGRPVYPTIAGAKRGEDQRVVDLFSAVSNALQNGTVHEALTNAATNGMLVDTLESFGVDTLETLGVPGAPELSAYYFPLQRGWFVPVLAEEGQINFIAYAKVVKFSANLLDHPEQPTRQ